MGAKIAHIADASELIFRINTAEKIMRNDREKRTQRICGKLDWKIRFVILGYFVICYILHVHNVREQ